MELKVDIEKELRGFHLRSKFTVSKEIKGLLGASGSGKSMTLRCIAGLEKPTRGRITLNDRVLFDSEAGICLPARKRKVGLLFQNYALFPHMNVAQNISFPLEALGPRQRKEKVAEMLTMVQLEGLENRYPSQLSGGQQQRVALARALAIEPQVLLLDEPFSALDNHLRRQMEEQLLAVLENYQGVTLFVSHNMEEAYRVCRELIIMSQGDITASGPREDIFVSPPTLAAAQLTGCANISTAIAGDGGLVEATDWDCQVAVDKTMAEPAKYIGIRANQIIPFEGEGQNVFHLHPAKVVEGPYSVTIQGYIGINGCKKESQRCIHWELDRNQWAEIKELPPPWSIQLPPRSLFVMGA